MLQEIVIIRQVLKHAEGLGWIPYVPNLSTPYMTQGKRGRRAGSRMTNTNSFIRPPAAGSARARGAAGSPGMKTYMTS
jgi:hypothetical protein